MLFLTTIRKPSSVISLFPSLVQGAGVCKHTTANKQMLHDEVWPRLSFAPLRSKSEQIGLFPRSIDYREKRTRKSEVFRWPKANVGRVIFTIASLKIHVKAHVSDKEFNPMQAFRTEHTEETLLSVMVAKFIFKLA